MAGGRGERSHPVKDFGDEVRRLRHEAGLSQGELAKQTNISKSHVGKIERGLTRCDRRIAAVLDDVFSTGEALQALWDELVENAAVFPDWFIDWYEIETALDTVSLIAYEPYAIYGLVQTPAYAEGQLRGDKGKAEARVSRQSILRREDPPPPRISVLLAETALTNEIGSPEVMRAQLTYLLEVASLRLAVQVVPSPVPPEGTDGSFSLATMANSKGRKELAHVGTPARGFTLSDVADLIIISHKLAAIREHALPVGLSRSFIQRIVKERWT